MALTMEAGTRVGVASQPKPPGVPWVARLAENCNSQPREPLYGLPKTPRNTLPSGATIGEAVLSSRMPALLAAPLRGSFSTTEVYCVDRFVVLRPRSLP